MSNSCVPAKRRRNPNSHLCATSNIADGCIVNLRGLDLRLLQIVNRTARGKPNPWMMHTIEQRHENTFKQLVGWYLHAVKQIRKLQSCVPCLLD